MSDRRGVCYWCKRQLLSPQSKSELALTKDHIVPRSQGGRRKVNCCRKCNHLKADMDPRTWRQVMSVFPNWFWRFKTPKEVRVAHGDIIWKEHRERQHRGKWPRSVTVPHPQLCRGLTI